MLDMAIDSCHEWHVLVGCGVVVSVCADVPGIGELLAVMAVICVLGMGSASLYFCDCLHRFLEN